MTGFIFDARDPQASQDRRKKMASALMNPPTDVGSGLASIGDAIAYRAQQSNPFPSAPGGSPLAPFGRIFGMFNKQGLY